jgi:uncharacterized membrane protein
MNTLKQAALALLILLYICAGINHFWHPLPYYSIIPPYLPKPYLINIAAGVFELLFGLMLIFSSTRKMAAYGIVLMLIAFIPAHIYMIQKGGCMGPKPALCIPLWLAWVRLFPLQFILIWWAFASRSLRFKVQS